jgi:hypothetical protein
VLLALAIYLLVGLALAARWTGAAAIRRVGALTAFLVVVVAWPLVLFSLIFVVRNY